MSTDASDAESAIYVSFSRLGWGVGLAWVTFVCILGYGGKHANSSRCCADT